MKSSRGIISAFSVENGGTSFISSKQSQIVKKLNEVSMKKKKKYDIKSSYVKENIWIFLKCIIS